MILELIFLLVVLPKRVYKLAKQRRLNPVKWIALVDGAWLGAEFVGAIIINVVMFTSSYIWQYPEDPEKVSSLVFLPSLIAGLVAAEFALKKLRAKPLPHYTNTEVESKSDDFN